VVIVESFRPHAPARLALSSDNRWFAWFVRDKRTAMKWRSGVFGHKIITKGDITGSPGYWGGRVD
jgi:hypothetical protein